MEIEPNPNRTYETWTLFLGYNLLNRMNPTAWLTEPEPNRTPRLTIEPNRTRTFNEGFLFHLYFYFCVVTGNVSKFTCNHLTAGVEYTLRVDTFLNNSATDAAQSTTQTTITGMSHQLCSAFDSLTITSCSTCSGLWSHDLGQNCILSQLILWMFYFVIASCVYWLSS